VLTLPRLRRLSQILFFTLFLLFLYKTEIPRSLPRGQTDFRLPFPAPLFLQTDPFVAVINALATRALYRGLLWCLAILIPTLFLGRFFCGWICPLGTLHHAVSNLPSESKRGARRIASNRYRSWQALKYYLLFALLAAALLGSALGGLADPIALAVRSLALSVFPALGHAGLKPPHFRQAFPLGVTLIALLALNLRVTRFWCRALCPLGALLGVVSRWSILGLEKRQESCGDCNRCLLHCQGGDDPIPGARWRKAECHLCMNCVVDCPESGLRFRFFPTVSSAGVREGPDLKRRHALAGLAAGVAAVPLLRANTGLDAEPRARLIRPPAALDEKPFLARCIRCGECMKVCPNNALHPAFTEAGWEGIWSPVLAPRVGYCEPGCTLCGQVCPTGAIAAFTAADKGWAPGHAASSPIRLGTAFYDRGRCLPWSMATECIVCQEWCPVSPKAVYLETAEAVDSAGARKLVRQPYLDPLRCVGCGACEYACPVRGLPAVYVTSVGESRSKTNRMLIGAGGNAISWFPQSGEAAGWIKTGETRQFEAEDLWKYVDGDAERYLRAGVRRALTSSYRFEAGIEAVADIYAMGSPQGAAAIFDSESSIGSRSIPLGDAARSYGQSLTFRHGPYFIRLVAYQDSPRTEPALMSLGRAIAAKLPVAAP
jgi:polyferredoxin